MKNKKRISTFFGAYKSLFKIMQPDDKKKFFSTCFYSFFYVLENLIPAQIIGIIINKLLGEQILLFNIPIKDPFLIWQWILLSLFVLLLIRTIFSIANRRMWVLCEKISYSIRNTAFGWTLIPRKNLDLKVSTGDVTQRVNAASSGTYTIIQEFLVHQLPYAVCGIFSFVCIMVVNIWCGLIILGAVGISLLLVAWRSKYEKKVVVLSETQKSKNSDYIVDTLKNIMLVQLFTNSSREKKLFNEKNEQCLHYYKKHSKIWSVYWFFANMLRNCTLLGIFFIAAYAKNAISIGSIYIIINYMNMVFEPIQNLGWLVGSVIQEGVTLERLFELKPNEEDVLNNKEDKRLKNKKLEKIELKNIEVRFDDNKSIKNINVCLQKGKLTILKGASGKGKTTTLRVLCGITEKSAGEIILNNTVSVDNMFPYLQRMSIAMQGECILNRSVSENIFYAKHKIPKKEQNEYIEALKIKEISKREFEEIKGSETANKLSGGEKKRINVARTLIKNAEVYIFDEPTNELDNENAMKVVDIIQKLKKKAIVFVISHDARLYPFADDLIQKN